MKTKTEELLDKLCVGCSLCYCKGCDVHELREHLAPQIAKERITDKLREYEDEAKKKEYYPVYNAWHKSVLLSKQILDINPYPELYSTYDAWFRVIVEMPETIPEAFGWGDA